MPGTNFVVRTETPADYSGLQGLVPHLDAVGDAGERARAKIAHLSKELGNMGGASFGDQLDRQIKAHLEAVAAGNDHAAQQHSEFQRQAQARFAAAKTSAAQTYGGGEAGQIAAVGEAAGFSVPAIGAFIVGAKGVSEVMGEVAENDRAAVTLTKFGVSMQEAADASDRLDGLELFFQGDRQQAAEAYGKIINGTTRGLEQLGIQLDANSTKEERLAVIDQLAARGKSVQASANQTLTGSLGVLWRGMVDTAAETVSSTAHYFGLTQGIGMLNEALGFAEKKTEEMEEAERKAQEATKDLNKELKYVPETADQAAKSIDRIKAAAENAGNAVRVLQTLLKGAGKPGSDEEIAAKEDRLAVLNGEPEHEVKKRRADINFEAAAAQRQTDANNAEAAIVASKETLKKLDDLEKKNNAQPSRQRFSDLAKKGAPVSDDERKAIEADIAKREKAEIEQYGHGPRGETVEIPRVKEKYKRERDQMLGSGRRTADEEQEFQDLAARRRQEDEAINAQRREAQEAMRQANAVKSELPARRKVSEMDKSIAEKEYEKAEADRKAEAEDKRQRGEMQDQIQREKFASEQRAREQAEAEARKHAADQAWIDKHNQMTEDADAAPELDAHGHKKIRAPRGPAGSGGLDDYENRKKTDLMPSTPGLDALKTKQRQSSGGDAAGAKMEASADKVVAAATETFGKLEGLAAQLLSLNQRLTTVESQQGK